MSSIHGFFQYARERQDVLIARTCSEAKHWTEDRILQSYRFCNVFREDDTTTAWFREKVRFPLASSDRVLLATIAFRWFNRISTAELLLEADLFTQWDSAHAKLILHDVHPVVTGAYIIKTPTGMNKLDGVCWCIDQAQDQADNLVKMIRDLSTLEFTHELLTRLPYLGPFMAYEIVTDLRHTTFLDQATDIGTWASPGPGCVRGIGRIFFEDPKHYSYNSSADRARALDHMRHLLLLANGPQHGLWPHATWEMREVEHTLCEFDKYERVRLGEGRLKQRYQGGHSVRHT